MGFDVLTKDYSIGDVTNLVTGGSPSSGGSGDGSVKVGHAHPTEKDIGDLSKPPQDAAQQADRCRFQVQSGYTRNVAEKCVLNPPPRDEDDQSFQIDSNAQGALDKPPPPMKWSVPENA